MTICAQPLSCSTEYGELTIAGWSLHTGAWCAFNLSPLYESPAIRHENVLVETQAGRSARSGLTDETDYSLRMVFSGAETRLGVAYQDHPGGLMANLRALQAQLVTPIRSGTAALAAELAAPDPDDPAGTITFEFDCQPLRLTWTLLPNAYARAVLELRVPVPEFTEEYA